MVATLTIRIRIPGRARALARWLVRSSVIRPVAAQSAAVELRQPIPAAVVAEIRWAFAAPRAWLSGVAVNLTLALAWLVVQPVQHDGQRDWVVLIATYFSSFILADVTTTNMLGVDRIRVEKSLSDGTRLWRLLLVKNMTLVVIVGVPTMLLAIVLTLWMETPGRLRVTVPDVAVPLLCWLGVGNIILVLFAVGYEPLIRRWRQRRQVCRTARWLTHLALPYALFYLADPNLWIAAGHRLDCIARRTGTRAGAGSGPQCRPYRLRRSGVAGRMAGRRSDSPRARNPFRVKEKCVKRAHAGQHSDTRCAR